MKKLLAALLVLVVVGLLVAGFLFRNRLESDPPQVTVSPDTDVVGAAPIEIAITDAGSGLRSVTAILSAGGAEQPLLVEQYARPIPEKRFRVEMAKVAGLKEGPAILRITARDDSLRNSGRGNETRVEKRITVDVTPPQLDIVADDRYVNFGGAGIIAYRSSPDTVKTGVKIGAHFFPGVPGLVKGDPGRYLCIFAHPYDAPADARTTLVATDKAGNTREMRLAYELKNVKYKKSTIAISDSFYQNKVVPLLADVSKRQGSVKDVFIAVNKDVRKQNEDKITEVTSKVTPQLLWRGAFHQLSNSKVEANFADSRTYTYNGEPIDTAFHLGYDLSVTKNYPVEAANSGTVAFTGDLGLYGNAIIIDHGVGLYTLYGHLSAIDVKVGDAIKEGQVIGKTGETGFAGGDHLHYGVYLDGVAVLPVEWWDPKWIRDNVDPKVEGGAGRELAESQPPPRPARRHRR